MSYRYEIDTFCFFVLSRHKLTFYRPISSYLNEKPAWANEALSQVTRLFMMINRRAFPSLSFDWIEGHRPNNNVGEIETDISICNKMI